MYRNALYTICMLGLYDPLKCIGNPLAATMYNQHVGMHDCFLFSWVFYPLGNILLHRKGAQFFSLIFETLFCVAPVCLILVKSIATKINSVFLSPFFNENIHALQFGLLIP